MWLHGSPTKNLSWEKDHDFEKEALKLRLSRRLLFYWDFLLLVKESCRWDWVVVVEMIPRYPRGMDGFTPLLHPHSTRML